MPRSAALALITLLLPAAALAQDDDAPSTTRGKDEVVREVNRGLFLKADIGSTLWMNTHGNVRSNGSPLLSGVVASTIGVGQEFVDRERFSVAWEADFYQGLFNGPRIEELQAIGPFIQGDVHIFGGLASIEMSTYPTRRLGVGIAAGGGIIDMPLLMEPEQYNDVVVAGWGGQTASLNAGPLPTVMGNPTLEYYTKLSHFSIGLDVPIMYVIGFDLGISPLGYMKYTF